MNITTNNTHKLLAGVILAITPLTLAACGGGDAPSAKASATTATTTTATTEPDAPNTAFGDAAKECSIIDAVADDGDSLIFDTEGEEDYTGHSYATVACVLVELDMPESVMARLDNTRALDGTQTADWGDYTMTWNYHPDSGLNLIIEEV